MEFDRRALRRGETAARFRLHNPRQGLRSLIKRIRDVRVQLLHRSHSEGEYIHERNRGRVGDPPWYRTVCGDAYMRRRILSARSIE
jgi:hypothetical protein